MKIPITPRSLPVRPGSGLFISSPYSKILPFYHDDAVSKVGLDISDIEQAVGKAISLFQKYNRALKTNLGDTSAYRESSAQLSNWIKNLESIKGSGLTEQEVEFKVDDSDISRLTNLEAKLTEMKAIVDTLTQSTKNLVDQLVKLGSADKLDNIAKKTVPRSDGKLSSSERKVINLTKSKLGNIPIGVEIDEGTARGLYNNYKNILRKLAKSGVKLDKDELSNLLTSAKDVIKTGGESLLNIPSFKNQGVATQLNDLIKLYIKASQESEKAAQRISKANEKLASPITSGARLTAARQVTKDIPEQLKPGVLSSASTSQFTSIQKGIEAVDRLLASSKISLKEYDQAIAAINGRTFLPADASADLIKARDLISGIANTLESIERRSNGVGKVTVNTTQAKRQINEGLSTREKSIVDTTEKRLGPLYIAPEVDQAKARGFITSWKNIYRQLAKSSADISDEQLEHLLTAAQNALKTHGKSLIDIKLFDQQGAATKLNNLITLLNKVEAANEKAIQTANKQIDKNARTAQSAISADPERKRQSQFHDLITKGGLGQQPLVEQLRPGSFAELSPLTTRGESNRVQNYINTINQLLSSGKASWAEYGQAIDAVVNKKILPPDTAEGAVKLRNAIAGIGGVIDSTENRAKRMNEALISFKNVLRLGIVSELYNIYSQLRSLADQSIDTFNKLTIQISQIQAITQDAISPTTEWAQALRQVSDATGKDLTELSVAAYDALSNQITRAKDDTVAFLNTATEFGKTVGASPTEAVNLLSSSINAYGKSVDDAEQLSAEFFAVVDIGKVKVADLQNILGRVGITAATLGVKTHELGAALAVLTQNGLTTEDAITRLNNLLVKLFNPTKEMEKLFLRFGVTSAQQFIAINDGLGGTVRAIEEAVKRGDAATAELFPEIRTLAGYFGLSGQNAAKFADTIDQVLNSAKKFKNAKVLTGDISIGQRFQTEIQRIKNVFTIDFAEGFSTAIVNLSDKIGGLANRISNLLSIGLALVKIVGPILAISIAVQGLTGKILFLNAAWKLFIVAFTKNPVVAVVTGIITAFTLLHTIVEQSRKSAEEFANSLNKVKQQEFGATRYNKQLESADKLAIKHAETIKDQITKAWSQASANMQKVYNKAIEQSGKKLEALTERTKSAFSDVSNLISKTISGLENYPAEAGKIQRKLPFESAERDRDTQVSYLQELLNAQKQFESQAGQHGVSANQVRIYDQIVDQINKGTEQLRQEANSIFTQTLDPSEQKAAVDAYIGSIDKAIAEYKKLESEIISSGVTAGRSWAQIQAQLDAIVAPRLQPLFEARASAPKTLSIALESAKKSAKDALGPLYDLQGEMKAVEKEFLDIDLEKKVSEIGPTYEGGKLTKSRKQNVQEQVFKPFEEKLQSLQDRFKTARPELEQRGLAGPLEEALNHLQERIDARREQLNIHLTDLVNKADIDSNTQLINSFSANFVAAIKASTQASDELRQSLQQTYGELGKLAGTVDTVKLPKDFFGREEGSIENLKSSNPELKTFIENIQRLKSEAQKPLTRSEEYIPNVDAALKGAQQSLQPLKDKLKNLSPEQYLKTFVGQQEVKLNTIEEFITKLKLLNVTQENNQQKTKENEAEYQKLQTRINQVGEGFKKSGADFDKFVRDNKEQIPQLLSDIQKFNTDLRGDLANTPSPETRKPDYSLITSPTHSQQQTIQAGGVDGQILEEAKRANILNETQNQLLQTLIGVQGRNNSVPTTTPASGAPKTGEVVPTLPVDNKAISEQLSRIQQSLDAQNKNIVQPQTESMGGMISYYSKGGWAWMQPKGTDTVPAMLTPGEYIMPRKMTEKYRHILERMRAGNYEDGGEVLIPGKGDTGTGGGTDPIKFMSAGGLLLEKGTYYPKKKRKNPLFMASGGEVEKAISDLTKLWNSQPGTGIDSAKRHYDELHKFASAHSQQILDLATHLHHNDIPRDQIFKALKGIDTFGTSKKLVSQIYHGEPPEIGISDDPNFGAYNRADKLLAISRTYENAINPLAVLSHELEHAKQGGRDYSPIGTATAEIPAVFGDIAFGAKAYELSTGKKLDRLINISPTIKISASQLADIFEKQGYFKGRSATEILASPEGQDFLKKLVASSQPFPEIDTIRRNLDVMKKKANIPIQPSNSINKQVSGINSKSITPLPNRLNKYDTPTVVGGGPRSESFTFSFDPNSVGDPTYNLVRNMLGGVGNIAFGRFGPALWMGSQGGKVGYYQDGGSIANALAALFGPSAQIATLAGMEAYKNYSQTAPSIRDLDPAILKTLRTPSLVPLPNKPKYDTPSPVMVGGPQGNESFSASFDPNTVGDPTYNLVRNMLGPIGNIAFGRFGPALWMGSQGGKVRYLANGGLLKPKGTDTIPAMLSQGEYVMPKKATDKYLPTLERMRNGAFKDREPNAITSIFNRNKHEVKDYSKVINDHGTTYHIASGGSLASNKNITSYYIKGGLIQVESRSDAPRHMATNTMKQYIPAIGQMVQNTMKPRGTDTIPAMLSKGEYVMPAKQTERYLPVLEGMRRGIYMANGGMVGLMEELASRGNRFSTRQLIDLPNRTAPVFRTPIHKISTSIDNTKNTHVNIHVNMTNEPMNTNVGRKIGKEIQREIRRGNLKLS